MGLGEEAEKPAALVLKGTSAQGWTWAAVPKPSSDLLSPSVSYTPKWLQVIQYGWGDCSPEKGSGLLKVTEQIGDRARSGPTATVLFP